MEEMGRFSLLNYKNLGSRMWMHSVQCLKEVHCLLSG